MHCRPEALVYLQEATGTRAGVLKMDELRKFRNNTPYLIAAGYLIAGLMAWSSGTWTTVLLFPTAALAGGVVGLVLAVPDQRRNFRSRLPKRRGHPRPAYRTRYGTLNTSLFVLTMVLIAALRQEFGRAGAYAILANLVVALTTVLLVPWIDALRHDYPYD
jgi:hypothetical protein